MDDERVKFGCRSLFNRMANKADQRMRPGTPANFHQGQGNARKQAVCRAAVYSLINIQNLALIGKSMYAC